MALSRKSTKALSIFGLAMLNIIAIDSLRNLPINASFGTQLICLYAISTIGFLIPCCLITAMLATRHPKTGGSYVWIQAAFGKQWGFVTMWLLWVYNIVWFPTILSFMATNIAYLINPALAKSKVFLIPIIIGAFTLSTLANMRGIKTSAIISTLGAIIGTLIPMLLIITLGVWWVLAHHPLALSLHHSSYMPHVNNLHDMGFMVVIIFSLVGIEMSGIHAGDVKNPRRDFPRALLLSAVLIVISSILASLTIALIIPKHNLGLVSGIDQSLMIFLTHDHLQWLFYVVIVLILLGSFAGMTAWSLGPARGMMVAARDGCAPQWFAHTNQHNAPNKMLIIQLAIVILLALLFLCFKSINSFYGTLSILSGQLALFYYVLFFAAGIKLGLQKSSHDHYQIPLGKYGVWIVGLLGLMTSAIVITLGFLPPEALAGIGVIKYELVLIVGLVLFIIPPFVIYSFRRRH